MDKPEQEVVVKKKRNRPDLANFGAENAEPGDNSRYLRFALVSWDLPPIDISDAEQVKGRIEEYFRFCIENDRKPNMKGMGNWLGVHRDTVNQWMRGEYRSSTHTDVIKKAVDILEELWVDYIQDITVTPNNPLGYAPDQKQLEARVADIVIDGD